MFFKSIFMGIGCLYSILALANDPFFDEYPSCQFLTTKLKKELAACQWIGTLSDSQAFPILICQNELILLKKERQDLMPLLSLPFEFKLGLNQLNLQFSLPHYCEVPFHYLFKQNEVL